MADIRTLTTSQLRQASPGERFKVLGVIKQIKSRSDKNNRPFWDLSLVDSEGSIDAKVWSDGKWWDTRSCERTPFEPASSNMASLVLNAPVVVIGTASEFRGKQQYQFLEVFLLDPERFPISGFIQSSPVPVERMEEEFRAMISSCGPGVRTFLEKVFSGDLWKSFRELPAAVSHHHAYVHGLLEHTLSVARGARALAETYKSSGVEMDLDIVTAGGLLHDIGKIESYKLDPFPSMTIPGTVIDHIALGFSRFTDLAREHGLDGDLVTAIGHILISHHGRKEYGSPVLPATPEAMVVSSADELDFIMFCWSVFPESGSGEPSISDYHPSAQRRFWRREISEEDGS
ncbi:MAG: HD domain-containing protein [Thermovirgaceae bacterium]|nr:HD domain-containing protein [Thermovirgaceae bacterium]